MTLDDIKVGDEVAEYSGRTWSIYTVGRVTDSQIIIGEHSRYWKKNGRQVGSGDSWRRPRIQVITDEVRTEIAEQDQMRIKRHLVRLIEEQSRNHMESLSVVRLRGACRILKIELPDELTQAPSSGES